MQHPGDEQPPLTSGVLTDLRLEMRTFANQRHHTLQHLAQRHPARLSSAFANWMASRKPPMSPFITPSMS